jgi:hypothetical protein
VVPTRTQSAALSGNILSTRGTSYQREPRALLEREPRFDLMGLGRCGSTDLVERPARIFVCPGSIAW